MNIKEVQEQPIYFVRLLIYIVRRYWLSDFAATPPGILRKRYNFGIAASFDFSGFLHAERKSHNIANSSDDEDRISLIRSVRKQSKLFLETGRVKQITPRGRNAGKGSPIQFEG